jgi:hypothetical protein
MPESKEKSIEEKSGAELMDEGYLKFQEEMEIASAPPKKIDTLPSEEECPECPRDKDGKIIQVKKSEQAKKEERKPFKILKVQGKEIPVYSEQELIDFAQMGIDYTKKRQADSSEKKKWEEDFASRVDKLNETSATFNKIWDTLQAGQPTKILGITTEKEQPKGEVELTKEKLYEQYQIDPEFAEPYQLKMIDDIIEQRKTMKGLELKSNQAFDAVKIMMAEKALINVQKIIIDTREKYPFEEIFDEEGQNLTAKQFLSLLKAKMDSKDYENKPLPDIFVETVKDIHYLQSKGTTQVEVSPTEEMSPEEFAEKFPSLFQKTSAKLKDQHIAEYLDNQEKLPPSLKMGKREVDLSKLKQHKGEYKDLDEALLAGFSDPEVSKGFSTGG